MNFYSKINAVILNLTGILFLLLLWKYLSIKLSELVVASPHDTFIALGGLFSDENFIEIHFFTTIKRIIISLAGAVFTGGTAGIIAGLFENIRKLIEPLRWLLMTIPGVVVVVVFMLLFGMGDKMVISLGIAMTSPVIFINVSRSVSGVDIKLLEMAEVYRFSFLTKLKLIYANVIAPPFFASVAIAAGNGIRIIVLAEVLGAESGIGYLLSISRTNLDTPGLYALALVSMAIAGGIEFLFLKPLKKKFLWEK